MQILLGILILDISLEDSTKIPSGGVIPFLLSHNGGGCKIFPSGILQVSIRGLYKWSEDKDVMVDDVTEKSKYTTLCFDGENV